MSAVWLPKLEGTRGPAYVAIVDALVADVNAGTVANGTRLLPHRTMAARLNLSVGTVARAYAEAARLGLISSEVGRGTFVSAGGRPAAASGVVPVDMSLNAPPDTGAGLVIGQAMAEVARTGEVADLLGYLPHAGLSRHRTAMAEWLRRDIGLDRSEDDVALCNGAQHGIALALMAALRPGDAVLAEDLTYPGIAGIAERLGHRLHGVALDAEGIVPESLDAAFAATGARLLYCMPTLQTPTGATMPAQRRKAIAATLRRHEAWAIEDDVYAFLAPDARPTLAELAPERVCYVTSLAKCLAPGLRIGALVTPNGLRGRVNAALRATGWMASPLLTATAVHLLRSGAVAEQAARKRVVAAERWRLAADVLGGRMRGGAVPAFHVWLPVVGSPADIVAAAAMRGVVLAPPVTAAGGPSHGGLRLCLGAPESLDDLRRGLAVVAGILDEGGGRALV
jgi:DNA-binding transcriptional MocR family regulator